MSITSFTSVLTGSVPLDEWWSILSPKQGGRSSRRLNGKLGVLAGEESVEIKTKQTKPLPLAYFFSQCFFFLCDSPSNYSIPLNISLSYGSSSYAGIRQLSDKARCFLLENEANSQGKGGGAWHVSHRLRGGIVSPSHLHIWIVAHSLSLFFHSGTLLWYFLCVSVFIHNPPIVRGGTTFGLAYSLPFIWLIASS